MPGSWPVGNMEGQGRIPVCVGGVCAKGKLTADNRGSHGGRSIRTEHFLFSV